MSKGSRSVTGETDAQFLGEDKEWLIIYCREQLKQDSYDYFVFGHRHLPLIYDLNSHSKYINLGDWIGYNSYAVFDGNTMDLKTFEG